MQDPAVTICDLSKKYTIGSLRSKFDYVTLRESLTSAFLSPLRAMTKKTPEDESKSVWALKDVSFSIQSGDVVGLIGRNGAGKSTLLKILSRITEPTSGSITLRGRVASMLEVGTGFHPELTGRENIFLNGAILGMPRIEIHKKLDSIIEFSGIRRFIETPVKRYSTGMYLRLAFSVAAHLEPEILLVDEVLAVGDFDFQKKCLGKMEEVGKSGRTVVFVSHDIPAVLRLCQRAILLEGGKVVADGPSEQVCRTYMRADNNGAAFVSYPDQEGAPGDAIAKLRSAKVTNQSGQPAEVVDIRRPVTVEICYWNFSRTVSVAVTLSFVNEDGIVLFTTADSERSEWRHAAREPGLITCRCEVPGNFFAEGRIFINVWLTSINPGRAHVQELSLLSFQVVDPLEGDSVRGEYTGFWPGVLRPSMSWSVDFTEFPEEIKIGS